MTIDPHTKQQPDHTNGPKAPRDGATSEATEGQIDRAREWTSEHYPDVSDGEYQARFSDALSEIIEIDAAADRAEARLVCRAP